MKVLLTGATGFIGSHLIRVLKREGHELVVLTRNPESAKNKLGNAITTYAWNAETEIAPAAAFQKLDAIIHLAGEGIAEKRWSKSQKEKIYQTRVQGTKNLLSGLIQSKERLPHVMISASAIGYYGDRKDELLFEDSKIGKGFLAETCHDWERAVRDNAPQGIRLAQIRIGIVLGSEGGALKKLLPIFKLGAGGPIGTGHQWMSWIHVDDLAELFAKVLRDVTIEGPVNGVAPSPVSNREFSLALGKALKRPAILPVPPFALKLAMGEMAELVLDSQRVSPRVAITHGFQFHFQTIERCLHDILAKAETKLADTVA